MWRGISVSLRWFIADLNKCKIVKLVAMHVRFFMFLFMAQFTVCLCSAKTLGGWGGGIYEWSRVLNDRSSNNNCSTYSAPPLTLDAVFEAVKTVSNWRWLAWPLIGWYNYSSDDHEKLNAIQRQHVSGEACIKALVEAFLLGEGDYQPSWRRVIHALHETGDSPLAEKIKINAEPQQGEWVGTVA